MRNLRPARPLGTAFLTLVGLVLGGCSAQGNTVGTAGADLEAVQVTTLTTLQASSGSFLSPSPQQDVPSYVNRSEPASTESSDGTDRARVDVALLFRSTSERELPALEAELTPRGAGDWSPIEHDFPTTTRASRGVHWPIQPVRDASVNSTGVSSEWSGWQAFGGLSVRAPSGESYTSTVATLDFEVRGARSPLVLTLNAADELVVTNQSGQTIERALLIYSHAGGVAVTSLSSLAPGASRVTALGPKEQPPERLLELARAALTAFFEPTVGADLAKAMAEAKSIPFLETHGFRLISLVDAGQAPTSLSLSPALVTQRQVIVSHSEILKLEEQTRVLAVVANDALDVVGVRDELGRFSEGKLEFAETSADAAVSARAETLLSELRAQ